MDQLIAIAIDVDSTLVSLTGDIDSQVVNALGRFQARGVEILLFTGRAREATQWLAESLGVRYFVCSNGASGHDGDSVLWSETIDAESTGALIDWAANHGVESVLSCPDGYFATGMTSDIEQAAIRRSTWPVVRPLAELRIPAHKIQLWSAGHLFEDLSRRFRGSFTIARSATYLQIGPAGVDKGVALQRLIPHVGMGTGVIAAVGDSVNDVPMFSAAGVSIAVNPDSSDVAAAATLHVSGDGALFSALRTLEAWFFEHHVS